jgi:hypothetical protein
MIYGWCIFLAYYSVAGLLFASARKWGIDGFRKITLCQKLQSLVKKTQGILGINIIDFFESSSFITFN